MLLAWVCAGEVAGVAWGRKVAALPMVVCWVAQEHEQPDGLPALAPKRRVPCLLGCGAGGGVIASPLIATSPHTRTLSEYSV